MQTPRFVSGTRAGPHTSTARGARVGGAGGGGAGRQVLPAVATPEPAGARSTAASRRRTGSWTDAVTLAEAGLQTPLPPGASTTAAASRSRALSLEDDAEVLPPALSPESEDDNIRVYVRLRPALAGHSLRDSFDAVAEGDDGSGAGCDFQIGEDGKTLHNTDVTAVRSAYSFDGVLGPQCDNGHVYQACAQTVVRRVLAGFNGTVFAYGQTGSGKTHSILGTGRDPGITPRAIHELFDAMAAETARSGSEFLVRVSYIEVYNEEINDLLAGQGAGVPSTPGGSSGAAPAPGRNLRIIRDDPARGVVVEGLTEEIVVSAEAALEALVRGEEARHYGATRLNTLSSRSHTLFRIIVESRTPFAGVGSAGPSAPEAAGAITDGVVRVACLSLVDLAGSERTDVAATAGARLREGNLINKSLSTLALVIQKLAEAGRRDRTRSRASLDGGVLDDVPATPGASGGAATPAASAAADYVPYRNSKLTRLLRQSLGGNAFTCILCNVPPERRFKQETLSTLKFGLACKTVRNHVTCNKLVDDKTLLKQYKAKIGELKAQLSAHASAQAVAEAQAKAALALLAASAHVAVPNSSSGEAGKVATTATSPPAVSALSPPAATAPVPSPPPAAPAPPADASEAEDSLAAYGFGSPVPAAPSTSGPAGAPQSPYPAEWARAVQQVEAHKETVARLAATVSQLEGLIITSPGKRGGAEGEAAATAQTPAPALSVAEAAAATYKFHHAKVAAIFRAQTAAASTAALPAAARRAPAVDHDLADGFMTPPRPGYESSATGGGELDGGDVAVTAALTALRAARSRAVAGAAPLLSPDASLAPSLAASGSPPPTPASPAASAAATLTDAALEASEAEIPEILLGLSAGLSGSMDADVVGRYVRLALFGLARRLKAQALDALAVKRAAETDGAVRAAKWHAVSEGYRSQVEALAAEADAARGEARAASAEAAAVKAQAAGALGQLQARDARIAELEAALVAAHAQAEEATVGHHKALAAATSAHAAAAAAQEARVADLEAALTAAQAALADAEARADAAAAAAATAHTVRVAAAEAAAADAARAAATSEAEAQRLAAAKAELDATSRDLSKLSSALTAREEAADARDAATEAREVALAAQEAQLAARVAALAAKEQQLQAAAAALAVREADAEAAASQHAAAVTMQRAWAARRSARLAAAEAETAAARAQVQAHADDVNAATQEVLSHREEVSASWYAVRTASNQVAAAAVSLRHTLATAASVLSGSESSSPPGSSRPGSPHGQTRTSTQGGVVTYRLDESFEPTVDAALEAVKRFLSALRESGSSGVLRTPRSPAVSPGPSAAPVSPLPPSPPGQQEPLPALRGSLPSSAALQEEHARLLEARTAMQATLQDLAALSQAILARVYVDADGNLVDEGPSPGDALETGLRARAALEEALASFRAAQVMQDALAAREHQLQQREEDVRVAFAHLLTTVSAVLKAGARLPPAPREPAAAAAELAQINATLTASGMASGYTLDEAASLSSYGGVFVALMRLCKRAEAAAEGGSADADSPALAAEQAALARRSQQLHADAEAFAARAAAWEAERAEVQAALAAGNTALKAAQADAAAEVAALQAQRAELAAEKAAWQVSVEARETAHRERTTAAAVETEAAAAAAAAKASALRRQEAELTARVAEANEALDAKERAATAWNEELAAREAALGEARAALDADREALTRSAAELEATAAEVAAERRRLTALATSLQDQAKAQSAKESELRSRNVACAAKEEAAAHLMEQARAAAEEADAARAAAKAAEAAAASDRATAGNERASLQLLAKGMRQVAATASPSRVSSGSAPGTPRGSSSGGVDLGTPAPAPPPASQLASSLLLVSPRDVDGVRARLASEVADLEAQRRLVEAAARVVAESDAAVAVRERALAEKEAKLAAAAATVVEAAVQHTAAPAAPASPASPVEVTALAAKLRATQAELRQVEDALRTEVRTAQALRAEAEHLRGALVASQQEREANGARGSDAGKGSTQAPTPAPPTAAPVPVAPASVSASVGPALVPQVPLIKLGPPLASELAEGSEAASSRVPSPAPASGPAPAPAPAPVAAPKPAPKPVTAAPPAQPPAAASKPAAPAPVPPAIASKRQLLDVDDASSAPAAASAAKAAASAPRTMLVKVAGSSVPQRVVVVSKAASSTSSASAAPAPVRPLEAPTAPPAPAPAPPAAASPQSQVSEASWSGSGWYRGAIQFEPAPALPAPPHDDDDEDDEEEEEEEDDEVDDEEGSSEEEEEEEEETEEEEEEEAEAPAPPPAHLASAAAFLQAQQVAARLQAPMPPQRAPVMPALLPLVPVAAPPAPRWLQGPPVQGALFDDY